MLTIRSIIWISHSIWVFGYKFQTSSNIASLSMRRSRQPGDTWWPVENNVLCCFPLFKTLSNIAYKSELQHINHWRVLVPLVASSRDILCSQFHSIVTTPAAQPAAQEVWNKSFPDWESPNVVWAAAGGCILHCQGKACRWNLELMDHSVAMHPSALKLAVAGKPGSVFCRFLKVNVI